MARTPAPDRGCPRGGVILPILLGLIIYCIPWGIGLWLIDTRKEAATEASREKVREDLREIAAHINRESQPLTWAQDRILRFCRALRWDLEAAEKLAGTLTPIGKLFVFDRKGRRINVAGTTEGLRLASEACLKAIRDRARFSDRLQSSASKMVKNVIGNNEALEPIARNPGKLVNLQPIGLDTLAGVIPCRLGTGTPVLVLAILDLPRIEAHSLVREAVFRISKKAGTGFSFGISDLAGIVPPLLVGSNPGLLQEDLSHVSEREAGGFLAVGSILARRFQIGVSSPIPPQTSWMVANWFPILALTFATLTLFAIIGIFLSEVGLGLRFRILLLFGGAAIAGAAVFLGFARQYLESRERSVIGGFRKAAEGILDRMDTSFADYRRLLSDRFLTLTNQMAGKVDPGKYQRALNRISPSWRSCMIAAVYDPEGRVLARVGPKGREGESSIRSFLSQDILDGLAKWAIQTWEWRLLHPMDKRPPQLKRESVLLRYVAPDFASRQKIICNLNLGPLRMTKFNSFFRSADKEGKCFLVLLKRDLDRTLFLRKVRRTWRKTLFPAPFTFDLMALPEGEIPALRKSDAKLKYADLLRLHSLIDHTRSLQFIEGRFRGRDWLLVGRPGIAIEGVQLVLGIPLDPIRKESRDRAIGFLMIAAATIVFAMFLGTVFARVILQPFQVLLTGLEHLANSRFSKRIRLETGDELETIGSGVDSMLEEMEQLAVASTIQSQLLPSKPVSVPGKRAMGWIGVPKHSPAGTASDFGGEICDVFAIDDSTIGFFLVTLPERTMASALRLAAIKTHIRLAFQLGARDPASLLEGAEAGFLDSADPATEREKAWDPGPKPEARLEERLEGRPGARSGARPGEPLAKTPALSTRYGLLVGCWHAAGKGPVLAWRGDFLAACSDGEWKITVLAGSSAGSDDPVSGTTIELAPGSSLVLTHVGPSRRTIDENSLPAFLKTPREGNGHPVQGKSLHEDPVTALPGSIEGFSGALLFIENLFSPKTWEAEGEER